MKRVASIGQSLLSFCVLLGFAAGLEAQSVSNGVYGGYVASDAWFASMRRSAANQAMLRSLGGGSDRRHPIPPDYVEFAGTIVFPGGNPFPGKRIPDLRIACRDKNADPVERAPFVDNKGAFYTVFKKGQAYDLYWMYYFGGRERFASVSVDAAGPRQRRQVFRYRANAGIAGETDRSAARSAKRAGHDSGSETGSAQETGTPASTQTPPPTTASATESPATEEPPPNPFQFDLSGFPKQPANFEEQQVLEDIKSASTPALKSAAHERLGRYYEKRGDTNRAEAEFAKAKYWRNMGN